MEIKSLLSCKKTYRQHYSLPPNQKRNLINHNSKKEKPIMTLKHIQIYFIRISIQHQVELSNVIILNLKHQNTLDYYFHFENQLIKIRLSKS